MREPGGEAERDAERAWRRRSVSPITRRILAVNILALAVLVIGLLYVGRYRQGLIASEVAALGAQAELFAAALGEAAVGGTTASQTLKGKPASQIVRRLAATVRVRAQLIGTDHRVLADSRRLLGPGGAVEVEELPPPEADPGLARGFLGLIDRMFGAINEGRGPDPGPDAGPGVGGYDETRRALGGEAGHRLRKPAGGPAVLSVAVPVQRYKRVLGALVLTRDTRKIDEAVFQVRLDILKVFGVALGVTVLLSIYLAGTIARPMRRLAEAADRVRHGHSRAYGLPQLAGRKDEIGDLAGALEEMTEALWRRMDAIESFAADVAHEIKNPLTSLRSAVETAARVEDADQQRKLMAIIKQDVDRLDRLISDISNASRLDAELSRGEMAPLDLGQLLTRVVDLHQATRKEAAPRLALAGTDPGPFMVRGMEDRLVQVITNLIANALSFSPADGSIDLTIRRSDGWILLSVEDQGPGIAPGKEKEIFERFYHDRPESEKFGIHSGLGLSISRQIVETHGGEIRAENRPGGDHRPAGARFLISLPAHDGAADTEGPASEAYTKER